jgi:hypothetical protein
VALLGSARNTVYTNGTDKCQKAMSVGLIDRLGRAARLRGRPINGERVLTLLKQQTADQSISVDQRIDAIRARLEVMRAKFNALRTPDTPTDFTTADGTLEVHIRCAEPEWIKPGMTNDEAEAAFWAYHHERERISA